MSTLKHSILFTYIWFSKFTHCCKKNGSLLTFEMDFSDADIVTYFSTLIWLKKKKKTEKINNFDAAYNLAGLFTCCEAFRGCLLVRSYVIVLLHTFFPLITIVRCRCRSFIHSFVINIRMRLQNRIYTNFSHIPTEDRCSSVVRAMVLEYVSLEFDSL